MQNTEFEFENLLLLFENESTFEIGMLQAPNYKTQFEKHFECDLDFFIAKIRKLLAGEAIIYNTNLKFLLKVPQWIIDKGCVI